MKENYKFIWLWMGSSAGAAMQIFFNHCGVESLVDGSNSFNVYKAIYDSNHANHAAVVMPYGWKENHNKFIHLLAKNCPILWVERDRIEHIKHTLNHIAGMTENYVQPIQRDFDITMPYFFPMPFYFYCDFLNIPNASYLENVIDSSIPQFSLKKRLEILNNGEREHICLDFESMGLKNAFKTFQKLAKKLNFESPKNKELFEQRINRNNGDLIVLPAQLHIHKKDLENCFDVANPLANNPNMELPKDGIVILISTLALSPNAQEYLNITEEFIGEILHTQEKFSHLIVLIKDKDYKELRQNKNLYQASLKYLQGYARALITHAKRINANLVTETQILSFLKQNPNVREKLRLKLEEELEFVKANHSDYLKQWKYYQEFVKLCES